MLDKQTGALLFKINALCKEGGYQIIEEKELFSSENPAAQEAQIKTLTYLKDHGYIDVKYADEGVYCLCPLPDGRLYFENVLREKSDATRRTRNSLLLTLFGALCGSFIGAFIACLLWGAVLG